MKRRELIRLGGAAGALALSGFGRGFAAAAPLKVGFVLASAGAEVGWTKQHLVGVAGIRESLGDGVEITTVDNIFQPQDSERVFRSLAASGHRLVFGTSFSHGVAIARVAPQFPGVSFDCCAGGKILPNLGAFEARYHEGTWLAGVAAAKMSKAGKLGFIGGFPIPDIVGPANAFLLGAQSVRPECTCTIIFMNSWEDPGKEKEGSRALMAQGCDVIAAMTDSPVAAQAAEQSGVWSVGYASDIRKFAPTHLLTSMILDWRSIYVQDAHDIVAGTWKSQSRWQGLREGVVRMAPYAPAIPADVRALIARNEDAIKAGTLQPFAGEIRDQDGTVRVRAGTTLNEAETRSISWLVAGMQGRLKG